MNPEETVVAPEDIEALAQEPVEAIPTDAETVRVMIAGACPQDVPVWPGWSVGQVLDAAGYTVDRAATIFIDGQEAVYESLVEHGQTIQIVGRAKGG